MRSSVFDSLTLDAWSRRDSVLHRRDSRAKLVIAILLLLLIASVPSQPLRALTAFATLWSAVLVAACLAARLPLAGVLWRACAVLPFTLLFSLILWMQGSREHSLAVLLRSYASGTVAVLLVATTPIERLLAGLEWFRMPALLIDVVLILFQYLRVIADEAGRMRLAAALRSTQPAWQLVAGSLAVLFARSYDRAERIHAAMLLRGYLGRARRLYATAFQPADWLIVGSLAVFALAASLAIRGLR